MITIKVELSVNDVEIQCQSGKEISLWRIICRIEGKGTFSSVFSRNCGFERKTVSEVIFG